jgi:hypothetical protein
MHHTSVAAVYVSVVYSDVATIALWCTHAPYQLQRRSRRVVYPSGTSTDSEVASRALGRAAGHRLAAARDADAAVLRHRKNALLRGARQEARLLLAALAADERLPVARLLRGLQVLLLESAPTQLSSTHALRVLSAQRVLGVRSADDVRLAHSHARVADSIATQPYSKPAAARGGIPGKATLQAQSGAGPRACVSS